jgi:hypothetical protein
MCRPESIASGCDINNVITSRVAFGAEQSREGRKNAGKADNVMPVHDVSCLQVVDDQRVDGLGFEQRRRSGNVHTALLSEPHLPRENDQSSRTAGGNHIPGDAATAKRYHLRWSPQRC